MIKISPDDKPLTNDPNMTLKKSDRSKNANIYVMNGIKPEYHTFNSNVIL